MVKASSFYKAINDCQQSIEILQPAVPSNLKQRAKAFSRRGAAFAKLGMYDNAFDDTKHAYDLIRDPKIQNDLRDLEKLMQQAKLNEGS